MVEPRRREATRIHGNVTSGGRYGSAEDKLHVEPEVAPRGMEGAELDVPKAIPGALAENEDATSSSDQAKE